MTHCLRAGGSRAVSGTHLCRTVCRRAERRTVDLADEVTLGESIVIFRDRLGDYFFVLGGHLARIEGIEEVKWIS